MDHLIVSRDLFDGQIFVGIVASLLNIATHAAMMAVLGWVTLHAELVSQNWGKIARRAGVMMAAVATLMFAHCFEVLIWGWTYRFTDAVKDSADAFYFAFVNYTTLGYGDILPVPRWRMLGPMAAMNGILMFGWSTAVMYDILRRVDLPPHKPAARF